MNEKLRYLRPDIKIAYAVLVSPVCLSMPADSSKTGGGQGWAKKNSFEEDDVQENTDVPSSLPLWE